MDRILSNGFFLAAFALFGLAAYFYFAPGSGPSLEIAATEIDVADGLAGRESEVTVHVENTSRKPMRILGLAEC
jgi:uncharacterized protein (DUF58 family)